MNSSGQGDVRARPLVVTGDPEWLDDILQLAADARVEVDVATDLTGARRLLAGAPLVIVTDDSLGRALARASFPRRPGLVLLGVDEEAAVESATGIWQRAEALGADRVAFLPRAGSWLLDRIARCA